MSYLVRLQELFFTKDKRVHLLFCLFLPIIAGLMTFVVRDDHYILEGFFFYLYLVGGIYTGRWLCRRWLTTGNGIGLLLDTLVLLLAFGVAGSAGYIYFFVPGMPFNHMLETTISMSVFSFLILFCGFVIAVIRSAIREKLNGLVLAEQKRESELGLLRSQVSPHFLFNTLHNLYSLSINRPAEMPDLLLQLAELLRYAVYEADRPLVSLQEEIAYLRHYVALEHVRMADRLALDLDFEDVADNIHIAPMLLIVFVENAFKHGRNTRDQVVAITIRLNVIAGMICFSTENSCSNEPNGVVESKIGSGLGITNVTKRLGLLYPGEHSLRQRRTAGQYHVDLRLKTR
jgi:Histidine kinase